MAEQHISHRTSPNTGGLISSQSPSTEESHMTRLVMAGQGWKIFPLAMEEKTERER